MFGKKKKIEEPVLNTTVSDVSKESNLISLEDVQKVLSGDDKALEEQIEKARKVLSGVDFENYKTKLKSGEIKLDEGLTVEGLAKIQAERKARELDEARKQKEAKEAELQKIRYDANAKIQAENALAMENKARLEAEERLKMAALAKQQAQIEQMEKAKLQEEIINNKTVPSKKNNKHIKKTKTKNKKKRNFKYIATTILIIIMILFVFFLPQVRSVFNTVKNNIERGNIKTGKLICSLDKYSYNFDANYSYTFMFKNNQFESLIYLKSIRGDQVLDEEELSDINNNCNNLKISLVGTEGIEIQCSLQEGIAIERQELLFERLDLAEIKSSYAEYGGILPIYKYHQNINEIQEEMILSGYDCEKSQ